jgi:hypothetical protein
LIENAQSKNTRKKKIHATDKEVNIMGNSETEELGARPDQKISTKGA